jgi:hypothetical protein
MIDFWLRAELTGGSPGRRYGRPAGPSVSESLRGGQASPTRWRTLRRASKHP